MDKVKKTSQRLNKCLKDLHLSGTREYYEDLTEIAIKNSMSYPDYLLSLLEKECELRYNNRIFRLLKESKLPLEKKMDNFEMKRLPLKVVQQVRALQDGGFLERKENLLVFGNSGSGKTHLVCGICQELIHQDKRIFFTTCSNLVQDLLTAKKDLQISKVIKKLSRYAGLIIDDIGYVQYGREEMEVLFTLLAERYERGSILITSNLPFSKWELIFKDKMMTVAAIDRLVHHSVIIEMNLKSYRMEEAKSRRKK